MMKYDGAKTIISLFLMKARWTDRPTDRQTDCSMDGPMEGPSQGDACIYLNMFSLPCFLWGRTERDNLQGEEGLKSLAPPTAQTGLLNPYLAWEYIRGIELASPWRFLNFLLEPPKIDPQGLIGGGDPRS